MALVHKIKQLILCNQHLNHQCWSSFGTFDLKKNSEHLAPCPVFDAYQKELFSNSNTKINKVTTWNVQELWWHCHRGNKLDNIIKYIRSCDSDIICLQEVFEKRSIWRIINDNNIIQKYPHYLSGDMHNKFLIGENSGLLILSKKPILFRQFTPFAKSCCPDFYAAKGALYFTVDNTNFITTHLQSGNTELAREQLVFILKHSPFKKRTILLGDLNLHDPFCTIGIECNNTIYTHDSGNLLDHIAPLHSDINVDVSVDQIDLTNTSDHFPVHGAIS